MLKYWHNLFGWLRYWHHLSILAEVAFFILSSPTWLPHGPPYSLSLSLSLFIIFLSLHCLSLFISRGPPSPLIILSLSLAGGQDHWISRNPLEERSTKTTIRLKIDFWILD